MKKYIFVFYVCITILIMQYIKSSETPDILCMPIWPAITSEADKEYWDGVDERLCITVKYSTKRNLETTSLVDDVSMFILGSIDSSVYNSDLDKDGLTNYEEIYVYNTEVDSYNDSNFVKYSKKQQDISDKSDVKWRRYSDNIYYESIRIDDKVKVFSYKNYSGIDDLYKLTIDDLFNDMNIVLRLFNISNLSNYLLYEYDNNTKEFSHITDCQIDGSWIKFKVRKDCDYYIYNGDISSLDLNENTNVYIESVDYTINDELPQIPIYTYYLNIFEDGWYDIFHNDGNHIGFDGVAGLDSEEDLLLRVNSKLDDIEYMMSHMRYSSETKRYVYDKYIRVAFEYINRLPVDEYLNNNIDIKRRMERLNLLYTRESFNLYTNNFYPEYVVEYPPVDLIDLDMILNKSDFEERKSRRESFLLRDADLLNKPYDEYKEILNNIDFEVYRDK